MLPTAMQCLSKKMTRMQAYGFLTTTTMSLCFPCSGELMPRSMLSVGTALAQNYAKMI
nr:hypothetical protein Iba_chr14dCG5360 [Ipomoea batatas]